MNPTEGLIAELRLVAQPHELTPDDTHVLMFAKSARLAPRAADALEVTQRTTAKIARVLANYRERATELENALTTLVRLKDGPRDTLYHRLKPKAWDHARQVLDQS